jgi:hypothetical protein
MSNQFCQDFKHWQDQHSVRGWEWQLLGNLLTTPLFTLHKAG